jgi:hypothetical protein
MAFLPQSGAEPIAGYRLVERLGAGGYGEVWKAIAPGGLAKAIKIVFGHMQDARAEQELKALGRIKEVRHPFLLSLERFEIIDSQLFIVTELADRSIQDRFDECRKAGLSGIPRDELLVYLRDASDALDYMGEHYGLQHLDIKPQNLLLVGGRIKIADFGLVKDLQGGSATATGGVTPIYATPEAFDGRVSRYSDQYSLAIVYQEMLTGRRPFPGMTSFQLAAQHTTSPPILDPLPQQDRPAIARALAKIPEERFPTSSALAESLRRAVAPAAATPAVRVSTSPPSVGEFGACPPGPQAPSPTADEKELLKLATQVNVALSPKPAAPAMAAAVCPEPPAPSIRLPAMGETRLRPTLFLGVGGIAAWTLCRLKQRLQRRFGSLSRIPVLRLLLLDTDRAALRGAMENKAGGALEPAETLCLPLRGPEHYRDQSKSLLRWLDRRWLYNIPRSLLTEGARPLGRLALVDNAAELLSRLRETVSALASEQARVAAEAATGLGVDVGSPRVFLIASIAGATGGGMVLDLAYAVRQVFAELRLSAKHLCGVLIHATSQRPAEEELARLNAYAGLNELQHYSRRDIPYPGDPEHGLAPFGPEVTPFEDCYLLHLGDQFDQSQAEAATDPLAEYLYLNAASSLGSFFERWRQGAHEDPYWGQTDARLRSFGLCRYSVPRHTLANFASDLFFRHMVDRWSGLPGSPEDRDIEEEVAKKVSAMGLDVEALTCRFSARVHSQLGDNTEAYFVKLWSDLSLNQDASAAQGSKAAGQALGRLDAILGPGTDGAAASGPEPTSLESALGKQADELRSELGKATVHWLLTIVEQPQKRLKAASHADRCMVAHLSGLAAVVEAELAEVGNKRRLARTGMVSTGSAGGSSSFFSLRAGRRQRSANNPRQKLVEYAAIRLREIVLENTLTVLRSVAGKASEFGPELLDAHQRLRHFRETLGEPTSSIEAPPEPPPWLPGTTELLPFGACDLQEAARRLFSHIEAELAPRFDEMFQAQVLNAQGGLWGFVASKGEAVQRVKDQLQRRALSAILEATRAIDAAKLFLDSHREPDQGKQELLDSAASVAPNLDVAEGWQHRVLALPDSPAGATVRSMMSPALVDVPSTVLDSEGDIVICHEIANLPIPQMAAILVGDDGAYADAAPQVMTRVDVAWSCLALAQPQ